MADETSIKQKARLSRWWWFGVVAGSTPIIFDYRVLVYVYFSATPAHLTDWFEPVGKGQMILVAVSLFAATVSEALESSVANDHVRSRIVGFGWTFGGVSAVVYALIAAVERNHNDRWNVWYGVSVSFTILFIASVTTASWAKRRVEEK